MKYQIEFEGRKLSQTECGSYSEARAMIYKIARQCVETYRKIHRDKKNRIKVNQSLETRLQIRIIAKLKIRPMTNLADSIQQQSLLISPIPNTRISQIHRSYADV